MLDGNSVASSKFEAAEIPLCSEGSLPIGHRLLRGGIVYAATNFGLRGANFALTVVYSRFLTPADYGIVSIAEVIAAVVTAVSSLGLNAAVQPLYFGYVRQPAVLRRCMSTLLRFGGAVTACVVAVTLFAGVEFSRVGGLQVTFFPYVAIAVVTAAALQLVDYRLGLYQTEERSFSYSILAILCFLFTTAATVYRVIFLRGAALGMLSGKLVGAALSLLLAVWLCRRWLRGGWDKSFVGEAIPIGLPLVPHMLLALGLVAADRLILQRYRSMEEVGIYSLAYSFGMVMFLATSSISQAWSPVFYRLANEGSAGRHVIGRMMGAVALLLAAVAAFGSAIADPFIRATLDPRYWLAGQLIPLVVGGYLFHGLFTIFQLAALQARRAQFIWVVSIVALAANIGLNFAWVPAYGMYGAAYATILAYALEALLMYIYAQRVYALPVKLWRLLLAVATFVAFLSVTQLSLRTTLHICVIAAACGLSLAVMWRLGRDEVVLFKRLSRAADVR